jgi:hypothetical protein
VMVRETSANDATWVQGGTGSIQLAKLEVPCTVDVVVV